MYSYTLRKQQRRRSRRKILLLIVLILLLMAFFGLRLSQYLNNHPRNAKSATIVLGSSSNPKPSPTPQPSINSSSLATIVSSSLEGTTGTYAVVIKNLNTNERFFSNEHQSFESGSLYKLWVMAVVYQQLQNGTLTKDQLLSEDVPTLNQIFDIDPDLAELTDGTISLSVTDALNQMITISHNYAALLLTEKIKLSTVAAFLKQNGFNESSVGTDGSAPTTTAFDTELFLEKLYQGKLANPQYTKEMIDLLKNQQLNNKLPKYLPDDVVVAHKTGELDDFSHDAGVVYIPKGGYIIVAMSESDNPPAAEDRIAQLSKAVYDYFTKQ